MPDDKNMKAVPKLPRGGNVNSEPILRGDNDMEMVVQRKPKMRPRGGNSPVIGDNGTGKSDRLISLCYALSDTAKAEELTKAAVELFRLYKSLTGAGFTEQQAMELIGRMIKGGI